MLKTMHPENRIVLGILSCQKNARKRRAVDSTWARRVRETGVQTYFLVGRPGSPEEVVGDILYLDCDDSYRGLSEKVVAFLRFAQANFQFDYIFKCDDDTYIDFEKWIRIPFETAEFTSGKLIAYSPAYQTWIRAKGFEWNPDADQFMSQAGEFPCGGDGYFLSRRAVEAIVTSTSAQTVSWCGPSEDVLVTGLLKSVGVCPKVVPQIGGYVDEALQDWTVVKESGYATIHPVPPLEMRMIHWRNYAGISFLYSAIQAMRIVKQRLFSPPSRRQ